MQDTTLDSITKNNWQVGGAIVRVGSQWNSGHVQVKVFTVEAKLRRKVGDSEMVEQQNLQLLEDNKEIKQDFLKEGIYTCNYCLDPEAAITTMPPTLPTIVQRSAHMGPNFQISLHSID